ncbi:hypothetical protein J4E81_009547 [Alternaria sp. BMP 2799]|nr:hypothetical protein J4E81_009547 [Alternaria sp. BMP 2799]
MRYTDFLVLTTVVPLTISPLHLSFHSITQIIKTAETPTTTPTKPYQLHPTLPPSPVVVEAGTSDALAEPVDSALVVNAAEDAILASALCAALENNVLADVVLPLASPTSVSDIDEELSMPVACVNADVAVAETEFVLTTIVGVGIAETVSMLTTGVELLKAGTEQIA